jgi:hypothetical protein
MGHPSARPRGGGDARGDALGSSGASAGDITADVQAYTLSARRLQVSRITVGLVHHARDVLIARLDSVRHRHLALKSEGVCSCDLLDVAVMSGALVEAVAGVATASDQSPVSLPTV